MPASRSSTSTGEAFDVLITDVAMPIQDGFSLVREARERQPDLRALVMRGWTGRFAQEQALEAGALDLIEKPLSLTDLRGRLLEFDRPTGSLGPIRA